MCRATMVVNLYGGPGAGVKRLPPGNRSGAEKARR